MASFARIRALAETVAAIRSRIAGLAGITFDGQRDLYKAFGWKRELTAYDYRARWERGAVAGRIVEEFPNATWKGQGELIEDENPENVTEFESIWFEMSERLDIWPMFKRVDVLAGLGRYAVMVIGAPGKLEQPLSTRLKPQDIMYLSVYSEEDAKIYRYEENFNDPRYGLPTMYKITRRDINKKDLEMQVHWTRVIHVAEGLMDDHVFGRPRLQRPWNDLDNLDKLTGGGSEAFYQRAHPGIHVNLDKDTELDAAEEEKLDEETDKYIHGFKRAIRTIGTDVHQLSADTAPFSSEVEALFKMISAATGIPVRLLNGSERGELASTQDKDNFDDRVDDRRSEFAEPQVVKQFVKRMIMCGAMPDVEYDVRWPVRVPSESERVALAKAYAEINSSARETVVTANEIRDRALGWEPLDEEVVNAEDEESLREADDEESAEAVARAAARRERRKKYGTALDKRRRWWRQRREARKKSSTIVSQVA